MMMSKTIQARKLLQGTLKRVWGGLLWLRVLQGMQSAAHWSQARPQGATAYASLHRCRSANFYALFHGFVSVCKFIWASFWLWLEALKFCTFLTLHQLPGQTDAFGVDALGSSSRRPPGYAGLNEQLLTQLTYQIADSDKKVLFMTNLCV